MKKFDKNTLLVAIAPFILLILVAVLIFTVNIFKTADFSYAKNVSITYRENDATITITITNVEDVAKLVEIFKGTAKNTQKPDTKFGEIVVLFSGSGKSDEIYPANNNSGSVRYGEENEYYYTISDENAKAFADLLLKYDIVYPLVIENK